VVKWLVTREARPVDIATVLLDARTGDLRLLAEERVPYDEMSSSVGRLFALLESRQIEAVLVGGLAMLTYVEGRNTSDVDLIMTTGDLDRLPEFVVQSRDNDFALATFAGVQIDLLLTTNPLFEFVRRSHSVRREFSGRTIPCATVEGLVLLKLYALPSLYRQGDFGRINIYEGDVAALLQAYRPDVEPLVRELAAHVLPTDLAEIQKILADVESRVERFRSSQDGSPER
jgi:hypothetical protein